MTMRPSVLAALVAAPIAVCAALAGPASADTRYLAYDASNRVTTALTRGVTLEVERGMFGAVAVRRIISTTQRGGADIRPGGPDQAKKVLPAGSNENRIYTIPAEGDGRALGRALCPSADQTYLILGQVRAVRPLTIHAVGRWADGQFRHCVELSYDYRGEWALPPGRGTRDTDSGIPVRP